jgi:hypothetical protein
LVDVSILGGNHEKRWRDSPIRGKQNSDVYLGSWFGEELRSFTALQELVLDVGTNMDSRAQFDELVSFLSCYDFILDGGRVLELDRESFDQHDWFASRYEQVRAGW